jgi:hypothetical protein
MYVAEPELDWTRSTCKVVLLPSTASSPPLGRAK